MIIKNESSGQDFEPIPAGLHPAVCYSLVDCGTHEEVWQGTPHDRSILFITFELPLITIEIDGETKPKAISKKYTKSMHPKAALRHDLESWRGRKFGEAEARQGFDLSSIVGKNCQLNIVHNESGDKTYANINGIVPLGQGMKKYDPYNPTVVYDIDMGDNIPENVPQWLVDKIRASFQFQSIGQQNHDPWEIPQEPPGGMMREPGYEDEPDDLPF